MNVNWGLPVLACAECARRGIQRTMTVKLPATDWPAWIVVRCEAGHGCVVGAETRINIKGETP